MTPDTDPRDDAVVTLLRETDWSLPVPPQLVDEVVRETARELDRRRLRRVTAIAVGAVAAVIVVVAGVSFAAGRWSSGLRTTSPAATVNASPTPSPTPTPTGTRVRVGSFFFSVPEGWIVDPMSSSASARFGADGLQNDGTAPGPTDMPVELASRRLSTSDHHAQVYLTVVTPRPTAAHPGPSPAADPTDRRAAVATIIENGYGAQVGGATAGGELPGVPLGPAKEFSFGKAARLVLVAPTAAPVVIDVQSVNTSYPVLLALLRSGAVGG